MTGDDRAPSPGTIARQLIRAAERASLATTLQREESRGWPYASLVMAACTPDGKPLLLLSDLADHTKNIAKDGRVSLLFDGTGGRAEALTGPRLSLLGHARTTDEPEERARYLNRHPSAAGYSGFHDFRLYRIEPVRAHLVAGFGSIHWLEAEDFLYDAPSTRALAARESDILSHMNADHAVAVALYAQKLLGLPGDGWVMTGIDPEGIDLRCNAIVGRLAFETPVFEADTARKALVALAQRARAKAGAGV